MTFRSEITDNNGTFEAVIAGRLDSATSSGFEKSLQELFGRPKVRVLIDFAALDYVSSAGLRVVLMAAKRAKQAQGELVLCGLQPHVKSVFEISGFLKILTVVDDRAAAVARLQG
ncbi:MAG TPA: STAS domain-containing protein [Rhodocyclaceae bacterium]|nr:STAS domain-containing protein [Rhodocyclaceae bacterium]